MSSAERCSRQAWPTRGACRLGSIAIAGWLIGCATAPVEQIRYFAKAYDTVNTVGQPLLDDLAIAERQQGQSNALAGAGHCYTELKSDRSSLMIGYCNAEAAYFSDVGDPPATRALRGGLGVLRIYVDILISLSEGKVASDAVAEVNLLGERVSGLIAIVGRPEVAGALTVALKELQPLLMDAARQLSVHEVRRVLLNGAPKVTLLIAALEDATPWMFETVIRPTRMRLFTKNPPTFLDDKAKYETYRKIFSNYVVLLDQLREAWIQTIAATEAPSPPALGDIANRVGQIQAETASVLRAYAALRVGSTPNAP
jgi:hypothetical protein